MSLDCRILRKKGEEKLWYWFRDASASPIAVRLVESLEDVPTSIRHYFKKLGVITIGPDMARYFGILDEMYPDFPKCGAKEWEGDKCIAEFCQYAPGGDWEKCPYFPKKT